jgi:hypothetical protein
MFANTSSIDLVTKNKSCRMITLANSARTPLDQGCPQSSQRLATITKVLVLHVDLERG